MSQAGPTVAEPLKGTGMRGWGRTRPEFFQPVHISNSMSYLVDTKLCPKNFGDAMVLPLGLWSMACLSLRWVTMPNLVIQGQTICAGFR